MRVIERHPRPCRFEAAGWRQADLWVATKAGDIKVRRTLTRQGLAISRDYWEGHFRHWIVSHAPSGYRVAHYPWHVEFAVVLRVADQLLLIGDWARPKSAIVEDVGLRAAARVILAESSSVRAGDHP